MAEGGQREAELKAGRSEEQARNGVLRSRTFELAWRRRPREVIVVINLVAGGGQRGRKGRLESPAKRQQGRVR